MQDEEGVMHRTGTRGMAAVALAMLVGLSFWSVQAFAATARNVKAAQESWYQVSPADLGEEDPTCTLPTGCAPQPSAPVQPYPEDTLQVGIAAGRDTARTFLKLDLKALPPGAFITGGTLTLPVLADEESGSRQPDTADLSACPVAGAVEKARGGAAEEQPEFSCETAAKATYRTAKQPIVTVDLKPLAATLTSGGIAIVPSQAARESGATWQVAFPAREHEVEPEISAAVGYDEPADLGSVPPPPAEEPPPLDAGDDSLPADQGFGTPQDLDAPDSFTGSAPDLGSQDAGEAPVAAPGAEDPVVAGAPAPAPVAVPLALTAGYAYPAVWLAPLVLAAVAGLLARSLAGEIVLPETDTSGGVVEPREPNLAERLLLALRPGASSARLNT